MKRTKLLVVTVLMAVGLVSCSKGPDLQGTRWSGAVAGIYPGYGRQSDEYAFVFTSASEGHLFIVSDLVEDTARYATSAPFTYEFDKNAGVVTVTATGYDNNFQPQTITLPIPVEYDESDKTLTADNSALQRPYELLAGPVTLQERPLDRQSPAGTAWQMSLYGGGIDIDTKRTGHLRAMKEHQEYNYYFLLNFFTDDSCSIYQMEDIAVDGGEHRISEGIATYAYRMDNGVGYLTATAPTGAPCQFPTTGAFYKDGASRLVLVLGTDSDWLLDMTATNPADPNLFKKAK